MNQQQPSGEAYVDVPRVRAERDELIDLRVIMGAAGRHWLLIAIVSLLVLLATAILYFSTRPTYVATASLMVERLPDDVVAPANENQPVIPADSPTVDTAVAVLESPDLLGSVVDQLRLVEDPEFNPDLAEGTGQRASTPAAARDRAIRILGSGLDVEREGVSYAIAISYASPEPRTAATVANGVMAAYLDRQRGIRAANTDRAAELLGTRLQELRGEVLAAESAVADYRARHRLFAASADSSITQQQLSVLDAELASSRAAQAAAEARLAAVRRRSPEAIQEALSSGVVTGLRQQRAELSAVATDLANRYGPNHPERVRAEQQVADIDRQIDAEIARVASSLSAEASVARGRTASIAGSIGQLQGRLATDNAASVRLSELERNVESARATYLAFLDNYRRALARQGTETSGASAISEAQVPVIPSDPNPVIYLLVGLIAAAGLSGAAVLIAEARHG